MSPHDEGYIAATDVLQLLTQFEARNGDLTHRNQGFSPWGDRLGDRDTIGINESVIHLVGGLEICFFPFIGNNNPN